MLTPDGKGTQAPDALTAARRVHAICERFEADSRAGVRPRIEDYLDVDDSPTRALLVEELIALEIELRRGLGENPTPQEYLARFPDFAETVGGLLGQASTIGLSPDQTHLWPKPGPTMTSAMESRRKTAPSLVSRSTPPATGERFGKYELVAEMARGGWGWSIGRATRC